LFQKFVGFVGLVMNFSSKLHNDAKKQCNETNIGCGANSMKEMLYAVKKVRIFEGWDGIGQREEKQNVEQIMDSKLVAQKLRTWKKVYTK
jgi:hypothetical protein